MRPPQPAPDSVEAPAGGSGEPTQPWSWPFSATANDVTSLHLKLASTWIRRSDSRRYTRSLFFDSLRRWLDTHATLTPNQAVHVLNVMVESGQFDPFVEWLRMEQARAAGIVELCEQASAGISHRPHLFGSAVPHRCPGLRRAVRVSDASLHYHFAKRRSTGKIHVVSHAAFHWNPSPNGWGYEEPRLRYAFGCRGDWAAKFDPAPAPPRFGNWCELCLSAVQQRPREFGPEVHLFVPAPGDRQCPARAVARFADLDLDCVRSAGHVGHHESSAGDKWTDKTEGLIRLS